MSRRLRRPSPSRRWSRISTSRRRHTCDRRRQPAGLRKWSARCLPWRERPTAVPGWNPNMKATEIERGGDSRKRFITRCTREQRAILEWPSFGAGIGSRLKPSGKDRINGDPMRITPAYLLLGLVCAVASSRTFGVEVDAPDSGRSRRLRNPILPNQPGFLFPPPPPTAAEMRAQADGILLPNGYRRERGPDSPAGHIGVQRSPVPTSSRSTFG